MRTSEIKVHKISLKELKEKFGITGKVATCYYNYYDKILEVNVKIND